MNIEEIIKSSLENSEMPYDPKAWESMSARLDQALPVTRASKTSWKWAWVAAAFAVAGISAFFLVDKERAKTVEEKIAAVTPAEEKSGKANAENENKSISPAENKAKKADIKVPVAETQDQTGSGSATNFGFSSPNKGESAGSPVHPILPASDVKAFIYVSPEVNDRYCENEKIEIKNPNDYAITLVNELKKTYLIEPNKSRSIELSEAGNYFFSYLKQGEMVQHKAFKVQPKPKADFYVNDETLYDKGLPINTLKSVASGSEYTWMNSKGEVLSKAKEADIHLFTKGQHDITLKVEGNNGCSSTITKTIRCEVNYNLLAMNGFNPESASIKNRTFIPYALLERNVPFEMEIIDPKTGQVVYTTKNADEPWDGMNRITNQMIPEGATYMWRVKLERKAIGEPKNVYQGSITRM